LPPDVIKDCITGAIEARFGDLKKKKEDARAPTPEVKTPVSLSQPKDLVYGNGVFANGQVLSNGIGLSGHTHGYSHDGDSNGMGTRTTASRANDVVGRISSSARDASSFRRATWRRRLR